MATLGLSSGISCGVAATRRWWTRCWTSPSVGCWSATPPIITTRDCSGAGCTCCGTKKILYPKDRQLARWAAAVHHIYSAAKSFAHPQARQRQRVQQQLEPGPVPSLRPRPGSRPRQPVPAYREAHQGTVCLRGCPRRALGQQRCGAQPAALGGQPQNHDLRARGTMKHLFAVWCISKANKICQLLSTP